MSVVLVTGASSGIGAAIAIAFADAGWEVMAAGRDEGRLAEVTDVAETISSWAGELQDADDCEELISDTIDEFASLDCLVNCAGVIVRGDITETSDDDWRQVMTVNLDVPFFLARAAMPYLLQTEGSIVNIASDWGLKGGRQAAAYCASKGGIVLLTRAMALDHARDGVRVNAICPGDIDTPMLAAAAEEQEMDWEEYLEQASEASPNGRIGEPEEVAALTLFLASSAAAHITGAAIPIDGGSTA